MSFLSQNTLLRWMRSKSEERSIVSRNCYFAILIGAAQTVILIVPLAIFLTAYSSTLLTYVYMILGILVFLIGNSFTFFQRKLSFFQTSALTLIIFSASLFLFWGILFTTDYKWTPMVLLIWSSVASSFLGLVNTTLKTQLFTLQEGKKFFGIMGGARALGGMSVGFLTPLLVKILGVKNVLLLAPLIILAAIQVLFSLKKYHSDRFLEDGSSGQVKKEQVTFRTLQNKKYVMCLFILTIVSVFNYYSLDLLFNTEVKRHFINESAITSFLGLFSALSSFLSMIGGFFIYRMVLDKLGLIISLFLTPLIIGTFVVLAVSTDFIPQALGLVFGLISIAVLFERMLRESINGQSIALLYSPLRPVERQWAQFHYKVTVTALSGTVIGAILLWISRTWGIRISSISFLVLTVVAFGIAALVVVKRNYIKILTGALKKWALIEPEFTELDKDTLTIIKSHLTSRFPEEVIYALQTIESAESNEFPSILQQSLDSPLPDVRCYVLNKIEQYRVQSAEEKVKESCLNEKEPKVLGQALRALGAIADLNQFAWFKERLSDSNKEVASSCLISLFLHGSKAEKKEALELLYLKAKSPIEEERLIAATVLNEIDISSKGDLLAPLLSDSNIEVRLAACQAAGDVNDERLYSPLIESLIIPHLHRAASKSLLQLAPSSYIIKNFELFSHALQSQLLNLLGFIKNEQVLAYLQKYLTSSDRSLFRAALHSLKKQSFKASSRDQISSLLTAENKNILLIQDVLSSFNSNNTSLIHDLLCREIELLKESCFLLLAFIYPEGPILVAREGLKEENRNKNSYAIEILLQTLTKEDSKQFLPQLCFFPFSKLPFNEQQKSIEEALLKTLSYAQNCYIRGINSAAIYTIGILRLKSLADAVRTSEGKNDPFIDEIRPWALKYLV